MKVLVTVKECIDYQVKVRLNANQTQVETDGVQQSVNPFDDKIIRQGFIRKVYSLLTIQLMITCVMGILFMFYKDRLCKNKI